MPLLRVGHHDTWPTLGWEVIDFIEAYACHGPGDVEGEDLVLDDEEVRLLLDLYRLYPRDHARAGKRLVSRGRYSRPKGRRKSEIAGALILAEARGPVRFDGWDAAGRPVGRPIRSPFIRCLATEEGQTGNTYDNVVVMFRHALEAAPEVFGGCDVGLTRTFLPDGGEIRPSSASAAAKDGGKETFAVADEVHLYRLPEHRGMHRTVSRNLRKRRIAEPWMFETSTMFRPGEQSIGETGHDHAIAIAEGRAAAAGFYLNHREGTKVEDWNDDRAVLESLAEAYGDFAANMDLDKVLTDDIRDPEAEEADSRRYWLNQRHSASAHVFDTELLDELARPDVTIPDGELVVLSFDGARFHDSTSLKATDVETGFQWTIGLWERPFGAGDDWEVPEVDVDAAVDEAMDRWDVWRLYGDPPYWEEAMDRWAGKYGADRVVRWWTARDKAMGYALKAYLTAQRARLMTWDGNPDTRRHFENARRRETRIRDHEAKGHQYLYTIRKENPASPLKIDDAVTGIIGWEARGDAIRSGAKKRKRGRRAAF